MRQPLTILGFRVLLLLLLFLIYVFSVQYILQILAVLVLLQHFIRLQDFFLCDPAVEIGDLLQARDFAVLVGLDRADKIACVHQGLMGAGVQPGKALSEKLHVQLAVFQIDPVEIRDLQFSSG